MLGCTLPEFAVMKRLIPTAILAASLCAIGAPAPVFAQSAGDKVNQLIVYGNDPCPVSTDEQITVCARKGEGERFRIPEVLRDNPNDARNQGWTQRVKAYETVGAAGTNSCSPVGGTGATGCMMRLINAAYAERKQSSDVHFGKLIDAERQKRLQSVDADAAADQARVESLEKAYDAKLARERAGSEAAPGTAPAGSLATPPADAEPAPHQ